MSPKVEYMLILAFSIGIPICGYVFASSYLNSNSRSVAFESIAQQETPTSTEPVSLLFIGDIMLDRTIRKDGEVKGYANLFACLAEEFAKYDAVIGNLEGTVTDFVSVSRDTAYEAPESFRFTFDPVAVKALVDVGLLIVSIGNNHIRDFGDEGIAQTISYTQQFGLRTFGDPRPQGKKYTIETIGDTRVAFVAYNQFFGNEKQTLENLREVESRSDIQVIFSHWGDEYVLARTDTKVFAHMLVDNGADLIIGTHPHVIQEREQYEGAWIYYSLGNFIFDQYWEEAVRNGLAVDVTIQDKKITAVSEMEVESAPHRGSCIKKVPTQ